eukprot:UN08081
MFTAFLVSGEIKDLQLGADLFGFPPQLAKQNNHIIRVSNQNESPANNYQNQQQQYQHNYHHNYQHYQQPQNSTTPNAPQNAPQNALQNAPQNDEESKSGMSNDNSNNYDASILLNEFLKTQKYATVSKINLSDIIQFVVEYHKKKKYQLPQSLTEFDLRMKFFDILQVEITEMKPSDTVMLCNVYETENVVDLLNAMNDF